jgi:hypothetical protein
MKIQANDQEHKIVVQESDPLKYLFIGLAAVAIVAFIVDAVKTDFFYTSLEKLSLTNDQKIVAISCFENNKTCSSLSINSTTTP